jgi:hypothetical protein
MRGWMSSALMAVRFLGHLRLKPADPRRNGCAWRFSPSASGRIPREAKSPPSAVLRSSLRPARALAGGWRGSPGFFQPLPEGPTA